MKNSLLQLLSIFTLSSALILQALCQGSSRNTTTTTYYVLNFGAVGDGSTDDTQVQLHLLFQAFEDAWNATCESRVGSPATMHVPSGSTFLLQPIVFAGPCNSDVNVLIDGTLIAPSDPSEWKCKDDTCSQWITFHNINNLLISGSGTINGQGAQWWDCKASVCVSLSLCIYTQFGGTGELWDQSNCDDCISIGDGSAYLKISGITCGPGHGISVGSLGFNGANNTVEHVYVSDVVFRGTSNGARIKTWQGGKGYATDITFQRITTFDSRYPIIIDQFYCEGNQKCTTQTSAVEVSNVRYIDIHGTSSGETAVKFACSETVSCTDVSMNDIDLTSNGTSNTTSSCQNVQGTQHEVFPRVPCLTSN
ncbi:hypothetical protein RHMOL_Rhmol10G0042500 [Rhododendron molle]|uniref:Uncharacterized protein n=1 Tax=Rhododendron molle TaxID=49168 RepID=A0ACC0LYQ5_RHOML|nr:hypothetical protein RHMOL_Rhmol10G0042500 [Rhododendron molle]